MSQLLLTPVTISAIKSFVGRARPVPYETLALRKVKVEDYKLNVPHGYTLVYATGHYRPNRLARYMSVKGPAKWPGVEEVRRLMKLAGFKSDLEAAVTWADCSDARHIVHVVELM